jgi:hypothetical protein
MICIIYASAGRSKLMADPKEFTLPDLLTFQTMYLCGVAYMADPALMPGMIKKTQVPTRHRDLEVPVGAGAK